jgi:hypothetical protein
LEEREPGSSDGANPGMEGLPEKHGHNDGKDVKK